MAIKSMHYEVVPIMLPFLYQTRTLCSRGHFQPTPAQVRRSLHISSAYCGRRSSASIRYEDQVAVGWRHKEPPSQNSNKQLREDAEDPRRDRSVVRKVLSPDDGLLTRRETNESNNAAMKSERTRGSRITTQESIPFEGGEDLDEIPFSSLPDSFENDEIFDGDLGESDFPGETVPRPARDSTITIGERHAFERIFADIMARSKTGSERPGQESSAGDNQPFITTKPTSRRKKTPDTLDFIIDDALKSAEGVQLSSSDTWSGKKSQEELRTDVNRYPASLRAAAAKALGLVSARSPQHSQEEERDSIDGLEEIRQPERQRVENLMRAATTDTELWQIMEEEVFSLIERLGLGKKSAPNEENKKPRTRKPLDRSVYGPLYPSHLLLGLRLLDRSFAKPSPLALNVLPRIKSLGIISQVLGASTALYNELLRIYWSRHDDFLGVLKLLAEMDQAGLDLDEETLSIVNEINQMQLRVRRGDKGPALQALWSMPEFAPGKFKAWKKKIQDLMEERNFDASDELAWRV
jgi:Mtf2 family